MNEPGAGVARTGTVDSFSTETGLGAIHAEDGSVYQFHCIEIADGTREIEAGTQVSFEVLAKLGRYEASNVRS